MSIISISKTNFFMKTKFLSIAFIVITCLCFNSKASAKNNLFFTDTTCCKPDSAKVVSTNFPLFCLSWRVSADSSCKRPYGFTVQWRQFPGNGPWTEKIVIYNGNPTVNFCDRVSICTSYIARVRTICDSTNTTFSDWIYFNKFFMTNCSGAKPAGDKISNGKSDSDDHKINTSSSLLKPKEE